VVFRNCLKCSSLLVFDIWHTRCCTGLRVTSEMLARSVFRSRPGIKQVIGVVARAAFTVALLMPWLAILALLYLRVRRQACPSR